MKKADIKSKQELARRLVTGEEFAAPEGQRLYFDEAHSDPFRYGSGVIGNSWDIYPVLLADTEWFEDIPEGGGVICYVAFENSEIPSRVDVIRSYDPKYELFEGYAGSYKTAIPVKKEDAKVIR